MTPCAPCKSPSGYACDLSALKGDQRQAHLDRSKRLFALYGDAIQWHATGFVLNLSKSPTALVDLTQWAHDESLCCPFLRFSIEINPAGNPVVMKVTEPDDAAGFLRSELEGLGII